MVDASVEKKKCSILRTTFLYGRLIKRQINRESFDARSIYRILFDEYDLDLIIVDLRL